VFMAFLYHVFRSLRAPPGGFESRRQARLAQSLTASLIGFVVGAFFLTLAYQDMLYMLAGMAMALRQVSLNASRAGPARAAPEVAEAVA